MTFDERTRSPPSNGSAKLGAKYIARQSLSPNRRQRAPTFAESSHPLRRRRSSNLSDSIDSTKQSIRSSTDNLLLPRARSPDVLISHEPSHWHSVPLALALLPAIGGLFFHNGSVVVTDLTLLILAAVFLNWAVRLPWDWYLSAQSIRTEDTQTFSDEFPSDTIFEEGSEEDEQGSQPATGADTKDIPEDKPASSLEYTSVAAELRIHELLALCSCFVSPVIGAWLLHHIRSQLSRPSEGLVSNYNLTIFLLASELRPVAHLIKLVQARTLHLQRTMATNPHDLTSAIPPATAQDLSARLAELERHVADSSSNSASSKPSPAELTSQLRKSVQPDFDALNRAVRRYEKRATVLSLQTESRLQELEKRLSDAITLAAAAERSSQMNRQRRGSGVNLLVDWFTMMALLPIQIGWTVISLPGRIIGGVAAQFEGYVGQKVRREMKTAGKGDARAGSGSEKKKTQGRGQKKVF